MPDPIKCDPSLTSLEQDRCDLDLFNIFNLAEIVQVVIYAGLVQTRQHVEPRRVIVIPVYAEYRQLNAQRWTQVVGPGILEGGEFPLGEPRLSENLLVKDLGRLVTKKRLSMQLALTKSSGTASSHERGRPRVALCPPSAHLHFQELFCGYLHLESLIEGVE